MGYNNANITAKGESVLKRLFVFVLLTITLMSGCTAEDSLPYNSEKEQGSVPQESQTSTTPMEIVDVSAEETTIPEAVLGFNPMTIISQMSDEELVGQLFLARCPGGDQALADIEKYHLGGYVLFANDFKYDTPASMSEKINSYQEISLIPMLIAVDEEGGTVTRISRYEQYRDEAFSSPRIVYENGGLDAIVATEQEKCLLLKSLGVNVNLGPVCDIAQDPNAFMYDRSLGEDPQITADFVTTVVNIMADNGTGSVLKHFPGYGENADTHIGIAVDNRSIDELESVDLVPFQAGINAGCDAIMISHTYINCIDPDYPASLSAKVIDYLRVDMGYTGVIVTDDLAMDAISDQYGADESAILALEAGVDLLCCTDYRTHYQAVLNALSEGRLSREQLEEAACRIILWKYELGIL